MPANTLHFYDPLSASAIATTTVVQASDGTRRINAAASLSGSFLDYACATAVEDALLTTGNVLVYQTIQGHLIGAGIITDYSWDRVLPGVFSFTAAGLFSLYDGVALDRIKAYNTTIASALRQIFSQRPGAATWADLLAIQFTGQAHQYAGQVLSEDINSISAMQALNQLGRAVGGAKANPDASNWYADDVARVLHLSRVGGVAATLGTPTTPITAIKTAGSWAGLASQFKPRGGSSLHGLPPGAQITCVVPVTLVGGAGNEQVQFAVGVYAQSTVGGVYVLRPDGNLYCISQSMGVNALWMDRERGILYAATDRGVYEHTLILGPGEFVHTAGVDVTTGKRTGWAGRAVDVWVDGIQVYALAQGNQTLNGLLTYPCPDMTPVLNQGYDYWAPLSVVDVVAAGALFDTAYQIINNDQALNLHITEHIGGVTGARTTHIVPIPGGNYPTGASGQGGWAGTKICTVGTVNGVFILTTGGSDALFFVALGSTILQNINASKTLGALTTTTLNPDGTTTVTVLPGSGGTGVNKIVGTGPGGTTLLACTDSGLWITDALVGSATSWRPVSDAGQLAGQQITDAAAGDVNSTPGGTMLPMLAITGGGVYDSNTEGRYWRDVLAQPVDLGAYLWQLAASQGTTPMPGSTLAAVDPSGAPVAGVEYACDLDGEGNYVYTVVRTALPQAPGAACAFVDAPDLASTINLSPYDASRLLAIGIGRYAVLSAVPSRQVEVLVNLNETTGYDLLTLQPTDQVAIHWVGAVCAGLFQDIPYSGTKKIVEIQVAVDETGVHVRIVADDLLVTQRLTFSEIVADLQFNISRANRAL